MNLRRTGTYVKTGRKVRRLYDEHRNPFHWVDEVEFVPDNCGKILQSITWETRPVVWKKPPVLSR